MFINIHPAHVAYVFDKTHYGIVSLNNSNFREQLDSFVQNYLIGKTNHIYYPKLFFYVDNPEPAILVASYELYLQSLLRRYNIKYSQISLLKARSAFYTKKPTTIQLASECRSVLAVDPLKCTLAEQLSIWDAYTIKKYIEKEGNAF
jgi:hypothetical protein